MYHQDKMDSKILAQNLKDAENGGVQIYNNKNAVIRVYTAKFTCDASGDDKEKSVGPQYLIYLDVDGM